MDKQDNKLSSTFWRDRIEKVKKSTRYQEWIKDARKISLRYRNKRCENKGKNITTISQFDNSLKTHDTGYNFVYRTTKTMLPFLVQYIPDIIVDRENKQNDPVGRCASIILENVANHIVKESNFKDTINLNKLDSWLQGIGCMWLRLESKFEEVELVDEFGNIEVSEELSESKICFDYVAPEDFLTNEARTQEEIEWKARRVYLDKKDFKERFPEAKIDDYTFSTNQEKSAGSEVKTEVWEVWDKISKKVYFYSPKADKVNSDELLDVQDYPFDIEFPCPNSLILDSNTDSVLPTPIYAQIWTQINEIDEISKRINKIIPSIAVKAAYDKSLGGIEKILSAENENNAYPVDNPEKYVEKGGLSGAISFFPTEPISNVLTTLINNRNGLISDGLQILGINPILEGQTNSSEAYGTNRLKGSFGTMRIQDYQSSVVEYMEASLVLAVSMIAQTFSDEMLIKLSGIEFTDENKELIPLALQLIKEEGMNNTRLSIEIESTKAYYDESFRIQLNEFFTTLIGDIQTASQIVSEAPSMAYPLKSVIMAKIRSQRIGRTFEAEIEKGFDQQIAKMEEIQANPQPPQPSPDVIAQIQSIEKTEQAKSMTRQAEIQAKTQADMIKMKEKNALDIEKEKAKFALEQDKILAENARHNETIAKDIRGQDLEAQNEAAKLAIAEAEIAMEYDLAKDRGINGNPNLGTNY